MNQQTNQWVELDNNTIKTLNSNLKDKELIDDQELENLKKQKLNISTDDILLAKIFIKCYDSLSNIPFLENNDDYNKIKEYLKQFSVEELRDHLVDYGDGSNIGDYYRKTNIQKILKCNRIRYIEAINIFMRIFEEE